jgi:predicted Mrr-cat superfamily restriction endonuclease
MTKKLWVIRPYPNFKNHLHDFLTNDMVAIGWPGVGDLGGGLSRKELSDRLCDTYEHYLKEQKNDLAVAAGILDRFVNQVGKGDVFLVPDGDHVYACEVTGDYVYKPELDNDHPDRGYPHWRPVSFYRHKKQFSKIKDLPLGVRRAIDCCLTVFSIHSAAKPMWDFLDKAK